MKSSAYHLDYEEHTINFLIYLVLSFRVTFPWIVSYNWGGEALVGGSGQSLLIVNLVGSDL